jgi:hypothetical protein
MAKSAQNAGKKEKRKRQIGHKGFVWEKEKVRERG